MTKVASDGTKRSAVRKRRRRSPAKRRFANYFQWGKKKQLCFVLSSGLFIWSLSGYFSLPSGDEFRRVNPKSTPIMRERQEEAHLAGRPYELHYTWVNYSEMPRSLTRAVIVAEDFDFFSHHGFDYGELKKALWEMITNFQKPRGASTITQQLAKNLYLSLSRNPIRKIKEAIITSRLEDKLSKERILELYLNIIELGPGIFGVEEASRFYFGQSVRTISESQAALLAAIIAAPLTTFSPKLAPARVNKRRDLILRRMKRALLRSGLGKAGGEDSTEKN